MDLDTRIFLAVNAFARATPWLHSLVTGYANYGVVLFAALMIAGWWTARTTADPAPMAAALWTPLAALLALGINQPIADAVGRTRPCNALHDIVVLHCNTDPGLPSDHAVPAGAATAGLWLVSRRLGTITAIATIAMAFTRIYIGAHYRATYSPESALSSGPRRILRAGAPTATTRYHRTSPEPCAPIGKTRLLDLTQQIGPKGQRSAATSLHSNNGQLQVTRITLGQQAGVVRVRHPRSDSFRQGDGPLIRHIPGAASQPHARTRRATLSRKTLARAGPPAAGLGRPCPQSRLRGFSSWPVCDASQDGKP